MAPTMLEPDALRRAGRPGLAALLERLGEQPLRAYASRLAQHEPRVPLEPDLEEAFLVELFRLGVDPDLVEAVIKDLRVRRVLQTATHLTASEGPTFLAVHQLVSLGLPAGTPYVVAAYSNVPFSSAAWSGCLCHSDRHNLSEILDPQSEVFHALRRDQAQRAQDVTQAHERRLALVPGSQRDARVFRAPVPPKLREVLAALRPPLRELLPARPGESFSAWALAASQAVLQRVLPGIRPLYLDLTEVISAYLQRVLAKADHPVARLLFEPEARVRALAETGPLPLFGADEPHGKHQRWAAIRAEDGRLLGGGLELPLEPEVVCAALRDGQLAPGLLLTFAPLAGLNGFRCLGSFEQIEYLPRLCAALQASGVWPAEALEALEPDALATGRCVDRGGKPVWPLDLVLGTAYRFPEGGRLVDYLAPLAERLLGG